MNYRKLNAVTKRDQFPMPRIDEGFDFMALSQYFSTPDLRSGYWQMELEANSKEKTAFAIPSGLYEFETMPFGLMNAPASFQRLMNQVLHDLMPTQCQVYLDDVIIFSRTLEDHRRKLKAVFKRLREAGLKLNPEKCKFMQASVGYLGHVVSKDGIHTDPEKTEKVRNWPTPQNTEEVRRFLGLAGYYRRFVKGFADIAKPLYTLQNKNSKFTWTDQCAKAFDELKQRLTSAPILAFPDISPEHKTFILDTDASNDAIGACSPKYKRTAKNIQSPTQAKLSPGRSETTALPKGSCSPSRHF